MGVTSGKYANSDQCVLSVSVGFSTRGKDLSPSNSKTTSVQSTGTQRFLRNTLTLSCLYSLDSPH